MLCFFLNALLASAADYPGPYFHSGDGTIALQAKSGGIVRVTYRRAGRYDDSALQKINQVFGAPWNQPTERVHLRLIELLDKVQDHFHNAAIVLRSGYRSPVDNQALRARGKMAAQSSMHTEGAAIDMHLQGIPSADVFAYVKGLNCCGVGYYHGREVHIDAGPPRYWDETSSGTESREPQENAKIMLATDRDRYRAGETATLQFMRITDYAIGVPDTVTLEWQPTGDPPDGKWRSVSIAPTYHQTATSCVLLHNRSQAKSVQWAVHTPANIAGPLRARLTARFCRRTSEMMPEKVISNVFEIW